MGRKKTTTQIAAAAARAAVEAANEEAAEVVIGDDPEEEQELDALGSLAALGADHEGVRFVVKCLAPPDRKGTIEEVTRDELPELAFLLRDRYGPGKYSVQAFGPRGYVKGSHRVLTISTLAARTQLAPAAPAASSEFERWRAQEESRAEARRLEEREQRKFYLSLLVPVLPQLLQLLRGESVGSLIQAVAGLKGLSGEGGSNTEKLIETLYKGLELGKELGGGSSSDSWPGLIRETLKDLAPHAKGVLEQIAERRAGARPGEPPPSAKIAYQPVASTPTPASSPAAIASQGNAGVAPTLNIPEGSVLAMQLPLMNKLADELLEFAQNGADPGLAAEALIAKIPRAVRAFITPEQLKEWLTHAQWWGVLEGFRPALQPYQAYCDDVRQTLLRLMTETEADPENP